MNERTPRSFGATAGDVDLNRLLVHGPDTLVLRVVATASEGEGGTLRHGDLILCDASRPAAPGELGVHPVTLAVETATEGGDALAPVTFAVLDLRGDGRGVRP